MGAKKCRRKSASALLRQHFLASIFWIPSHGVTLQKCHSRCRRVAKVKPSGCRAPLWGGVLMSRDEKASSKVSLSLQRFCKSWKMLSYLQWESNQILIPMQCRTANHDFCNTSRSRVTLLKGYAMGRDSKNWCQKMPPQKRGGAFAAAFCGIHFLLCYFIYLFIYLYSYLFIYLLLYTLYYKYIIVYS